MHDDREAKSASDNCSGVEEIDGGYSVVLIDNTTAKRIQRLNLKSIPKHRGMLRIVALFIHYAASPMASDKSREDLANGLRPFVKYLEEAYGATVITGSADLAGDLVRDYTNWLKAPNRKGRSQRLSDHTVRKRAGYLANFLKWCDGSDMAVADRSFIGARPWKTVRTAKPSLPRFSARKPHDQEEIIALRQACRTEITKTVSGFELGERVRRDETIIVPPPSAGSAAYKSLEIGIKTMIDMYPDAPREHSSAIERKRSGYGISFQYHHRVSEISDAIYPTARLMTPFLIALAIATSFNTSTLHRINLDDIDRDHLLYGTTRLRIRGDKRRAGRQVYRTFATGLSDVLSPPNIVDAVETITRRWRSKADPHFQDRLFLFWSFNKNTFESFDDADGSRWDKSIKRFAKDWNLENLLVSRIRATGAELADLLSGGDIRTVQEVMQHSSFNTTYEYYRSRIASLRGREALARAMSWRERFFLSGGLSDSRENLAGDAATPGFGCFEPRSSPIEGQREGRHCAAYGSCPACPLSYVDVSSPRNFTLLARLREQLTQMRSNSPERARWQAKWRAQLEALEEFWLAQFPSGVIDFALTLPVPHIPAPE